MTTQHAPTTEQIQEAWDRLATRFDQFVTPESMMLAEKALRHIDLRPGTRLLDVGAGSGALSIPAARMGAHVLATDLAPTMIDRLNERARAEGLANLEGRVMDGQALGLGDDTFDVAVSVNGVSLFPDLVRGLAELVRVTRTGGRVVIVAFGPLHKAEFIAFFMAAMKATVPGFTPLPADPPPLPFQVADPAVLSARLSEADLRDVEVKSVTWDMPIDSAEHFWNLFTSSNPIGAQLVAELPDELRIEVLQVLDGMLHERSGGGRGAVLHAGVNIGIGTV
ncbi:Ubiquinone/menaquinone biosynthesis C-methylase UbiE [Amycolatopsis marina]|uniref:Ubiquinone/menaquinone biosynthesis C-methylase UbiE n=1 Tax=Amycolatopsis marina TaxID=490629 RepID=A0A1I0YG80_9PSEU|nr:methyltransferase domain-containing protein [Amycolatopsis marina]SFB12334.1 Ubiquinone/menaquinone biosynthesis C-methylase UbiE [Amycolatopsis marina]